MLKGLIVRLASRFISVFHHHMLRRWRCRSSYRRWNFEEPRELRSSFGVAILYGLNNVGYVEILSQIRLLWIFSRPYQTTTTSDKHDSYTFTLQKGKRKWQTSVINTGIITILKGNTKNPEGFYLPSYTSLGSVKTAKTLTTILTWREHQNSQLYSPTHVQHLRKNCGGLVEPRSS